MVLTHIAWAAIVTSASMVSYDLQVKSVAYSSTLLYKLNSFGNWRLKCVMYERNKKMVISYLHHSISEWMCTTSNACNN